MMSGVRVYNVSWKAPGRSFTGSPYVQLNFTGCDFDAYHVDDVHSRTLICSVTCPSEGITETVAKQQCNGTGCCSHTQEITYQESAISSLNLQFVRNDNKLEGRPDDAEAQPSNLSSLWSRISIETDSMLLYWGVLLDNHQNCAAASENKTSYACVSEHSTCSSNVYGIYPTYLCMCADGYVGNPYVHAYAGGCLPDHRGKLPIIALY